MTLARDRSVSNVKPFPADQVDPWDVILPAELWGPETDEDRWELGPDPSPEDSEWWAEHAPGNADGYDVEALDEMAALEAAAVDAMGLGLIPPDVAEMISRTGLVGLADAILHEGSDPRHCICEPCVWERTRGMATIRDKLSH